MPSDSAYFAKVVPIARLLIEASKGDFCSIPSEYSDHLYHEYDDGCVSLAPSLSKFEPYEEMENWELDEAIELLSKVEPYFWPDVEDIASVDVRALLNCKTGHVGDMLDYVEDNLGTSEKVQKVLKVVIEDVFGDKVSSIRDRNNNYPSPSNNFLQDKDGTFVGTFKFNTLRFLFEVLPTERGWVCTYRLDEPSLDSLEKPENMPEGIKQRARKTVRVRRWR